jgi:phosphatidylglycerophosphatase A
MREPLRPGTMKDPVRLLGTGFGAGLVPVAPGTAGSALGLLPAWLMLDASLTLRLAVVAAGFLVGIWICGESARRFGVEDHPAIVWDEIVGQYAVTLVIGANPAWLLPAFGLFRLFDILKPWPIRDVDHRLRGGLGIMLDDMLAAAYAAVLLSLMQMAVQIS